MAVLVRSSGGIGKHESQSTNPFHAFVCIIYVNVLLLKASFLGKPEKDYVGIIQGHGHRENKSLQAP